MFCSLYSQCKKPPSYTYGVDTGKTGYEPAGAYDDCLVWNARKTITCTESEDIDIRATNLPLLEFTGSDAALNAEENPLAFRAIRTGRTSVLFIVRRK